MRGPWLRPLPVIVLCLLAAACTSLGERRTAAPEAAAQAIAGKQGDTNADGSETWLIPSTVPGVMMRATLFRPKGSGPFRLAVVNHGSEQDASRRLGMPMPSFPTVTAWLMARNYAVLLPQRPGHGATGGRYLEDQGTCERADYISAGNGAADSIAAAIDYMTAQSFIRSDRGLVVGNSAGGWGALALAARNPPAVSGVVAFAAGRGGRDRGIAGRNCSPDRLISAAAVFGQSARVPILLLYSENDSYFPREVSAPIGAALRRGGAPVTYRLLPPVRTGEGHVLIDVPGPPPPWAADVDKFLATLR